MSKVISSKNLSELDSLIRQFKKISFSLRLLSNHEFKTVSWDGFQEFDEWQALLYDDVSALSDLVNQLESLDSIIRQPVLQFDSVSVNSLLSSSELTEFIAYCKDCLSADFSSMSECEKRSAYSSWMNSLLSDDSECNSF